MRRSMLLAVSLLALQTGCSEPPAADAGGGPVLTDSSRLAVDGGSMWYRVTGSGAGTPVILLHGGPGFASHYLKPLEALGDDRLVVRYDQLGSGKSDPVTDTSLFTVEHFVAQLETLRQHLGIERFHLYGHSWGTMLGVEYYRAHPERVASLTLASAALDARAWESHARELLATLPDSMVRAVEQREAERNYQAPDYQAALGEFYARYVWRHPVAADLDSLMASFNTAIYGFMWGPSEFTVTGTLGDFDATPMLPEISVPVLYTVGEFDEANPATIERFAGMTPGARFVVIPGAAHITAWDNPEADVAAVRAFLREADAGR
jgi:proline iminopeptidase